jgi:hypothetical protein
LPKQGIIPWQDVNLEPLNILAERHELGHIYILACAAPVGGEIDNNEGILGLEVWTEQKERKDLGLKFRLNRKKMKENRDIAEINGNTKRPSRLVVLNIFFCSVDP